MKNYLKGKKTYVTAFLAVITAVGSYVLDEIALKDMIEAIFAALTAMTIRAAITKSAPEDDPMQGIQNEK